MNLSTSRIGPRHHRPRVVIIGPGFGGLSAAKQLAKAPFEVTIIDRHNYHLFQPPSYQVVTAPAPGAGADLHRQSNPQHV
jgi:NADH dehydrogenase FAD-containing subunit